MNENTSYSHSKTDPNLNILALHPGWIRTNPSDNRATLLPKGVPRVESPFCLSRPKDCEVLDEHAKQW